MTYIYKVNELAAYEKTKKKLVASYCALLVIFLSLEAIIFAFANPSSYIYNLIANIVLSAVFAFYSFFFWGIKVKLTQKHIALLKMLEQTQSEKVKCKVLLQEDSSTTYMGLEFLQLEIKCSLEDKEVIRKVFYQGKEAINIGDCLQLLLCANIIVAYSKGCDNG